MMKLKENEAVIEKMSELLSFQTNYIDQLKKEKDCVLVGALCIPII